MTATIQNTTVPGEPEHFVQSYAMQPGDWQDLVGEMIEMSEVLHDCNRTITNIREGVVKGNWIDEHNRAEAHAQLLFEKFWRLRGGVVADHFDVMGLVDEEQPSHFDGIEEVMKDAWEEESSMAYQGHYGYRIGAVQRVIEVTPGLSVSDMDLPVLPIDGEPGDSPSESYELIHRDGRTFVVASWWTDECGGSLQSPDELMALSVARPELTAA